jgi:hypothetical protein
MIFWAFSIVIMTVELLSLSMWCDAQRRMAAMCDARHVACHDGRVAYRDKSHASDRLSTWLIAERLQDSTAAAMSNSFDRALPPGLLLDRAGPAHLEDAFRRQCHQDVARVMREEDVCVDERDLKRRGVG